jgi:hypothetical protein
MKKFKFTRLQTQIGAFILLVVLFFITLWLYNTNFDIFGDKDKKWGWFHYGVTTIVTIIGIVWAIISFWELDSKDTPLEFIYEDTENKYSKCDDNDDKPFNIWKSIKKWIFWIIVIILIFKLIGLTKTVYKDCKFIYNTSKLYHNTYTQKVQEKQGFYDKLWKTYLQKDKITNINRETFILVTQIIMENRADGKNVTWKWVRENQQIPYEEFTKFYTDLSNFITSQREGYFNIEKECQVIANKNNTLLDTFPNNLYNKALKLEKINFQYGFLSDSTINVFKTGKENVK